MSEGIGDVIKSFVKRFQGSRTFYTDSEFLHYLERDKSALAEFKALFQGVSAAELDSLTNPDDVLAMLAMGAANDLQIWPDDPRNFRSKETLASLRPTEFINELCRAAIVNDVNTIAILAAKMDVNLRDHDQMSALDLAAGNGNAECVKVLLDHGADPNSQGRRGKTAVHFCGISLSSKDCLQLLLKHGGKLDIKDDDGKTPYEYLRVARRLKWLK